MCNALTSPGWTVGETVYHLTRGHSCEHENCAQATLDPSNDIGVHAITDHHGILGMGIDCAQGRTHHQWIRFTDVIGLNPCGRADQGCYGAGRWDDSSLTWSHHVWIGGDETRAIHYESDGSRYAFNTIRGCLSKYHVVGIVVGERVAMSCSAVVRPASPKTNALPPGC